jgi:sec-independent protein translocase protein TatA
MGLDNPLHIAFLLILLLLVFGAKRLPEMGRSLGDGMRGFKDALGGHPAAPTSETAPQSSLGHAPAASPQPVGPVAATELQPVPVAGAQPQSVAPVVPVLSGQLRAVDPVVGARNAAPQSPEELPPAA